MKRLFLITAVVFLPLFFTGCSSSTDTYADTDTMKYVKEAELGTPISVKPEQTLLFHLESNDKLPSGDTGEAGYDEYTLVIDEDTHKRFCLDENETTMHVELYRDDKFVDKITQGCKNIELLKGSYLVKLINRDGIDHFINVEHRGGSNYTMMDTDTTLLHVEKKSIELKANKRATSSTIYDNDSKSFDTLLFQSDACTGCNLNGINLSHYSYGSYPNPDSSALSENYKKSHINLQDKYKDNTPVSETHTYKYSDLRDANLSYNIFNSVDFIGSNLENADLSHSIFNNCIFEGNNLNNVDFTDSIFLDTSFRNSAESIDLQVRSKPSLVQMRAEINRNKHPQFSIDYMSAMAVLMSDGSIYIKPDNNRPEIFNIGSPPGQKIISHPEMTWFSNKLYKYYTHTGSNFNYNLSVFVVTDKHELYVKDVPFHSYSANNVLYWYDMAQSILDGNDKVNANTKEWKRVNSDDTPCYSSPVATSLSYVTSESSYQDLETVITCKKQNGDAYHSWNRMLQYSKVGTTPTQMEDTTTNNTSVSTGINTQLTGINTRKIEVIVGKDSQGRVNGITLKNGTLTKSYPLSTIFGSDYYLSSYVSIGSEDSSPGYSYLSALDKEGNLIISKHISDDLTLSEAPQQHAPPLGVKLLSGVDSTDFSSHYYTNQLVAVTASDGNIYLFNFYGSTWSTADLSSITTASSQKNSYEGTNFTNAYFGLSIKNQADSEAKVHNNFMSVGGMYFYNYYLSDDSFLFKDINDTVFENSNLMHTTFEGNLNNIKIDNSQLYCNTLSNTVITDWNMTNGSYWSTDENCLNSLTNASFDATQLVPSLDGEDLKKFDLSDATNVSGLSSFDFHGKDMSGISLSNAKIIGTSEKWIDLRNSNWSDADISGLKCTYCDFTESDLSVVSASNSYFNYAYLVKANLGGLYTSSLFNNTQIDGLHVNAGSQFNSVHFTNMTTNGLTPGCTFDGVNLTNALLYGVTLIDCSFNETNLSSSSISKTSFIQADFSNADLSSVTFTDDSFSYGSCFDKVTTSSIPVSDLSTFLSSGTIDTTLMIDIRTDQSQSVPVSYQLKDGCGTYKPN